MVRRTPRRAPRREEVTTTIPEIRVARRDLRTAPDRLAASAGPYAVLVVCTGNICRSPAVEHLLIAELGADSETTAGPSSPLVVASAGVRAVVGAGIPEQMAVHLRAVGVSPDHFAAKQLTSRMVRDADLVIALTRSHRSAIVRLHPSAVRRTFTLRELARLAETVDPRSLPLGSTAERLAALIPLAAAQRGVRHAHPDHDDVVDPYGGDSALYRLSFDQLRPAVAAIGRVVRG
jgi:protein-tyrosine phosphatase